MAHQALAGRQAVLDMEVLVDVFVVVAIDEAVPRRLDEDRRGPQHQQAADGDDHAAARPVAAERPRTAAALCG